MDLTALLIATAAVTSAPEPTATQCTDILPTGAKEAALRPLAPEDLVRLRDIGPVDSSARASPILTLSPDGRRAAFQLRRADPSRNAYCLAMVVVDLAGDAPPRIVDQGGDLQLVTIDIRGKADFPTGIPMAITAWWSPDGRSIAFLKRRHGRTQIWRANADGSGSEQLSQAGSDVVDFRYNRSGTALIYATRPSLELARTRLAQEALGGYHYDDRFAPVASDRPFPPTPAPRLTHVLEIASGSVRDASASEARALGASLFEDEAQDVGREQPSGADLWVSRHALTGGAAPGALRARMRGGRVVICPAADCTGASEPWWMPGKKRVRFMRREGWSRASTGIYEWDVAAQTVRRLYLTDDVLADCAPSGAALICLREASLEPRRLERLDPETGSRELLFDPNPEFSGLTLGRVERLRWRNAQGLEVLGDLVRPVGYRQGQRYPLVVVQYDTRGFLRGGTGDEYPIQGFANRGYAVLSIRRPEPVGLIQGATSYVEGDRLNLLGFADRRSALSAIETGVRLVVDRGIADPKRVGITGLSDGSTQVIFALLHSSLFSAAAMSSCCIDTTLPARVGPAAAREFHQIGYPRMTDRNEAFWSEISLSLNARRVKVPTLLQLADDEYMSALESFTALREVGAPFDMFVFPGEHHVKWQPAHRLAVYRRALDWFDYWLSGKRSRSPDRQAELRHWDALREQAASQLAR